MGNFISQFILFNTFYSVKDGCKVEVSQSNIPDKMDVSKLELGWRDQIFRPMSKICGYPIEEDDQGIKFVNRFGFSFKLLVYTFFNFQLNWLEQICFFFI